MDAETLLVRQLASMRGSARPVEVVIGLDADPLSRDETYQSVLESLIERLVREGVRPRLHTRGALDPDSRLGRLLVSAASGPGAVLDLSMMSTDPALASYYEPRSPHPSERIAAARRLKAHGVVVEGTLSPMLPWISDTTAHLERVVTAFREAGAWRVRAAYIELDQSGARLLRRLPPAHRALLRGCFKAKPRYDGEAILLPREIRARGLIRLERIGQRLGLEIVACAEANPDLSIASPCFPHAPTGKRSRHAGGARTVSSREQATKGEQRGVGSRPRDSRVGPAATGWRSSTTRTRAGQLDLFE